VTSKGSAGLAVMKFYTLVSYYLYKRGISLLVISRKDWM